MRYVKMFVAEKTNKKCIEKEEIFIYNAKLTFRFVGKSWVESRKFCAYLKNRTTPVSIFCGEDTKFYKWQFCFSKYAINRAKPVPVKWKFRGKNLQYPVGKASQFFKWETLLYIIQNSIAFLMKMCTQCICFHHFD